MNDPTAQRLDWARDIAAAFSRIEGVKAIIVGGSVARGDATERSDIDLGLFWTEVAPPEERLAIVRELDGTLTRQVDNRLRYSAGNPRGVGCIDIITLAPTPIRGPLTVDLEHETVDGTWQVISQVVDDHDIALDKHELLHVLVYGRALYGEALVEDWRAMARRYPEDVVSRMVARHFFGLGSRLSAIVLGVQQAEWLQVQQGLLNTARALVLTLSALNRTWIHTDNPSLKGVQRLIDRFDIAPDRFYDRLGNSVNSAAPAAVRIQAELGLEVLHLIPRVIPMVNYVLEAALLESAIREADHVASHR